MKKYAFAILVFLSLSGCDSSGTLPASIPTATVSGHAVDALIQQGNVKVYAFDNGAKGALLGSAITDMNGYYSISIQSEDCPVLIEVTGGFYIEEASARRIDIAPGQILSVVENYKMGTPVTAAATVYTHIAAGLAEYMIRNGTPASTAIQSANTQISSIVGVNIVETQPIDITNQANASPFLSPGLQYGFQAAALSSYTAYLSTVNNVQLHEAPYNSITLAQAMYNDVVYDGLLNGIGIDAAPLSLGMQVLGPDVYRHQLAVHMLRMAGNANNKVSITAIQLLNAAKSFNDSANPVFADVAVIPLDEGGAPVSIVTPIQGVWFQGASNTIAFTSNDVLGPTTSLFFSIDNVAVDYAMLGSTGIDPNNPGSTQTQWSVNIDTTKFQSGLRSLTLTSTDLSGVSRTTAPVDIGFDNDAPTFCIQTYYCSSQFCFTHGTWNDAGSGVASVTWGGQNVAFTTTSSNRNGSSGAWGDIVWSMSQNYFLAYKITVKDAAGHEKSAPAGTTNGCF